MLTPLRHAGATVRRIFRIVVLFCVLRLIVGVAAIVLFDPYAVAWGYEATIVVAAACAVCIIVALCIRRYAPPHRSTL